MSSVFIHYTVLFKAWYPSLPPKAVPNSFGTRNRFCGRQFFHGPEREGRLGIIQGHYIYCALLFCYYYISSTSDHQALDPGGWGPLLYT